MEIIIFMRQKFPKVIVNQSNDIERQFLPVAVVSSNSKPLDNLRALYPRMWTSKKEGKKNSVNDITRYIN